MKSQTFTKLYLIVFFAGILAVGATNIIIDPVFHYHAPLKGFSYYLNKERYQNIGILRHFDYDIVMTGTSMAENSRASLVEGLFGGRCVKTCIMGASYRELSYLITTALETHPDCKTIICTLDPEFLIREADSHVSNDQSSSYRFPEYLYDSNPINDVEYLFNMILFGYSLKDIAMTAKGEPGTSFDEYTAWDDGAEYGREVVLAGYTRPVEKQQPTPLSDDECRMIRENLEKNVIQPAKNHPSVTFYYWIPPYSICYYDIESREGLLERDLDAIEYEMNLLTGIPNIKLFSFLDREDIVTDLSNYKDTGHYRKEVNDEIVQCISERRGLITSDNYHEYMRRIRSFYMDYDYDGIYK